MSLVVTQEGADRLWRQILGLASLGVPQLHLYGSSHVPAHTDTYSTYASIELAVSGYAPVALAPGNWTLAPVAAGAQATYNTISWTFNGACTVFGYWVADAANQYALFAEQFVNSFVYTSSGGMFSLILPPTLTSTP